MLKLNIFDMEHFLETVDACKGAVWMRSPDGGKVDITRQHPAQDELWERYRESGGCLPIVLDIPQPSDYMSIVSYYAGDC